MATVSKGPYYWDIRGASEERTAFGTTYAMEIPQGSTYLETNGQHELYIWNADAKAFELF